MYNKNKNKFFNSQRIYILGVIILGILYQKQLDFILATGKWLQYPSHIHPHCEVQFIRKGSLQAIVDGKEYTVNENEILFVMPYQVHSFTSICENIVNTFFVSHHHIGSFAEKLPDSPIIKLNGERKKQMCQNIIDYIFDEHPSTSTSVIIKRSDTAESNSALQLAKSFLNIAMESTSWTERELTEYDTARKVLEYCMKNYSKDISLAKIAAEMGVSTHTVTRVFSDISEGGFRGYINGLRLGEAIELLTLTDMTIAEISEQCGFGTQRTFNRVFLSEKGTTPLNYRNTSRQGK